MRGLVIVAFFACFCVGAPLIHDELATLVSDTHTQLDVRLWHANGTLTSFARRAPRNSSSDAELPLRVAIVCGMHGRERISYDVCALWVRMLATRTAPPALDLLLVPAANVAGLALAETDACWRGNARGVDLNRNFPLLPHFFDGNGDATPESLAQAQHLAPHTRYGDETYAGTHPLSEPESRALELLLRTERPDVLLVVHSGTLAALTPYDALPDVRPPNALDLIKFARWLMADGLCDECVVGQGAQVLYASVGTLADFAYWWLSSDLVLTLEVYGQPVHALASSSPLANRKTLEQLGCARAFNPSAGAEHAAVLARWAPLIELLAAVDEQDRRELRAMVRHQGPK